MVSLDTERDEDPDAEQLVYHDDGSNNAEEDNPIEIPDSNRPSPGPPAPEHSQMSGMYFLLFLSFSCVL
jgi:hypothetical protein